MRTMKFPFGLIKLGAILALSAASVAAQSKIAVMDFEQALLATAEMKKKAAAMEAKFKPRQDEIARLSKELQELQANIQKARPEDVASLQAEGQRKQVEAQRLSEDLQADVEFEREGILQDGAARIRDVVNKLRSEGGYDVILDISTALSFNAALDITKDATAAFDAAYPIQ